MGEKKTSIALSVAAVAAALALFCSVAWWRGGSLLRALINPDDAGTSSLVAVVHTSDGGVERLPLSEPCTRTYSSNLGTNVVIVEDGTVRIAEADCANQVCVQEGTISRAGQQLVCLPHRFSVEIESATTDADDSDGFDTVSR